MSRWRRALQQIGGPNALTIWAWIATIPLSLFVGSNYAARPSISEVILWTTILLLVHCILGLVMWLAHATVLTSSDRPSRPVVALCVFALLGVGRGLLLQGAQEVVGISGGVFAERMAINVVGSVIVLSLIAIVVDDYRVDSAIVHRLESAKAGLAALREQEAKELHAADNEVLAQVAASIESELRQAGTDASRVRAIADSIVRPISHQLAASAAENEVKLDNQQLVTSRLTFSAAFGRMVSPSPLALALIIEITVSGSVFARYGALIALANAVLGVMILFAGAWGIRRFLPLPSEPVWRLVVLATAFAALGGVGAFATSRILTMALSSFPVNVLGVMASTASAAIVLALWNAVIAGRRERQDAMAHAVADEAAAIERLSGMMEQRRLQAARFLHGPIQGELISAALKGESPEEVRQVIARRFAEYGRTALKGYVQQQMRDVIAAWSTILAIEFTAEDECWELLEADSTKAELVVDALSEGLTNVVRHATSIEVTVSLTGHIDGVELRVTSAGSSATESSPGIGLSQIRARGGAATLINSDGHITLRVVV